MTLIAIVGVGVNLHQYNMRYVVVVSHYIQTRLRTLCLCPVESKLTLRFAHRVVPVAYLSHVIVQ
jgi:hypothetical protein